MYGRYRLNLLLFPCQLEFCPPDCWEEGEAFKYITRLYIFTVLIFWSAACSGELRRAGGSRGHAAAQTRWVRGLWLPSALAGSPLPPQRSCCSQHFGLSSPGVWEHTVPHASLAVLSFWRRKNFYSASGRQTSFWVVWITFWSKWVLEEAGFWCETKRPVLLSTGICCFPNSQVLKSCPLLVLSLKQLTLLHSFWKEPSFEGVILCQKEDKNDESQRFLLTIEVDNGLWSDPKAVTLHHHESLCNCLSRI